MLFRSRGCALKFPTSPGSAASNRRRRARLVELRRRTRLIPVGQPMAGALSVEFGSVRGAQARVRATIPADRYRQDQPHGDG
jgi:hypothetical protein